MCPRLRVDVDVPVHVRMFIFAFLCCHVRDGDIAWVTAFVYVSVHAHAVKDIKNERFCEYFSEH